jgi:hypothetical protein
MPFARVTKNALRQGGELTWPVVKEAALTAVKLARIFHELASRDREDGCATGQPQGVGLEAYLNSTS